MIQSELKSLILRNTFTEQIRARMHFDEDAYRDLVDALKALSIELKSEKRIDRDLALSLYSIPLVIRNTYLSFTEHLEPRPMIADKLEDAWIDLDALVIECLATSV